jgi:hypothetical protein
MGSFHQQDQDLSIVELADALPDESISMGFETKVIETDTRECHVYPWFGEE